MTDLRTNLEEAMAFTCRAWGWLALWVWDCRGWLCQLLVPAAGEFIVMSEHGRDRRVNRGASEIADHRTRGVAS